MSAYLLYARTAITDAETSKRYGELVVPQIREFGGEMLATRGTVHVLEGEWDPQSVTIIAFADLAALRRWYDSPEYAPLKQMRLDSNEGDMIVVEGA